jgi:hypothetical protein
LLHVALAGQLGYERAHSKLLGITESMGHECNMPHQVVVSLVSFFELALLRFGAVEHVVSHEWTLPVSEVPRLLDQYGWKDDAKREHMQLLFCKVLRAVGDFRSELQHIMELGSAVEMEGRLSRAQQRATKETQRAFVKHGQQVLPTLSVANLLQRLESLVHTLSTQCGARVHELRERGSDGATALTSTAEEDDEVAQFASRLEAAHIE